MASTSCKSTCPPIAWCSSRGSHFGLIANRCRPGKSRLNPDNFMYHFQSNAGRFLHFGADHAICKCGQEFAKGRFLSFYRITFASDSFPFYLSYYKSKCQSFAMNGPFFFFILFRHYKICAHAIWSYFWKIKLFYISFDSKDSEEQIHI